jgi:transcriptional regulator with XRE-family HTH domain
MPKKNLRGDEMPTLVLERLRSWGSCIKTMRLNQKLRAADLCARMKITHPTLRRLENGDAGAGIGHYLNALMILGALDIAAPPLPSYLTDTSKTNNRVRLDNTQDDDDDF